MCLLKAYGMEGSVIMKKSLIGLIATGFILAAALPALAVVTPMSGTSTPNGNFVYIPSQGSPASTIRILSGTGSGKAEIGTQSTGTACPPASMVTSPNGAYLFVVAGKYVKSFSINANGTLNLLQSLQLATLTYGKQCAITPDGNYLYVVNSTKLYVVNVSSPAGMSIANSFTLPAVNPFGVAVKPDGTRIYVSDMEPGNTAGNVYVYNITASKISPSLIQDISGIPTASYLAVNSGGDKLFVRVFQNNYTYADVMVYDISATPISAGQVINVFKIKGNQYRVGPDQTGTSTGLSWVPHSSDTSTGYDIDTDNNYEGMTLSPNGWYMFFTHHNGRSGSGTNFRDTMYAVSIDSLKDGFDITNITTPDIWVMYGGYGTIPTDNTVMYRGWQSSDGVIATRQNKVYYTYSNGATFEVVASATGANIPPMAPTITYPLAGATGVSNSITWTPGEDDNLIKPLTYTVQIINADLLENAGGAWVHMSYAPAGSVSTPFTKAVVAGGRYYARVRAYDDQYTSPWAYTGPFTISPNFVPPPGWISSYLTHTHDTCLTWEGISGATNYDVGYGTDAAASQSTVSSITQNYYNSNSTPPGPLSGLNGRTWYYIKARTRSGAVTSVWSSISKFFTIPAPANVKWIAADNSTVTVTWEPVNLTDTPPIIPCASYEVSWGTTPDASGSGVKFTTTPYVTITGLTQDQGYYVKIRAHDPQNLGYSDWAPYDPFSGVPGLPVVPTTKPVITGINAGYGVASGYRGTTMKIVGLNFGSSGTVSFVGSPNTRAGQPGYWKSTDIAVSVPPDADTVLNSITVVRTIDAVTAIHWGSGAPYKFNVQSGRFIMDDLEGGVWPFSTCEAGKGPIIFANSYTGSIPERDSYITVECQGNSTYEIFGGVSTYGNETSENGYDISKFKKIKLRFRGSNTNPPGVVATFELSESNVASIGNTSNMSEVWLYTVPIAMDNPDWQEITIEVTTTGPDKFVLSDWYTAGNLYLDLNKIKAYQILTRGPNNKHYSVDYVIATDEVITGPGTINYTLCAGSNGNNNWIAFPFTGTGFSTTTDLIRSIGNTIPVGSRVAWADVVEVRKWDPITQTAANYSCTWNGTIWEEDGPNAPLVIGALYQVSVPISANGLTWTLSGGIPLAGSVSFTLANNASGNYNWITTPAYITGIATTTDLIRLIGNKIPIGSRVAWADVVEVRIWDSVTQTAANYSCTWNGSIWEEDGPSTTVNVPGPYVVSVPASANGIVWP